MVREAASHGVSKERAELRFIIRVVAEANRFPHGQAPEPLYSRPVPAGLHEVTCRHRQEAAIRRSIWASSEHQDSGYVLLVDLAGFCPIDQRSQSRGP